MATIRFQEVTRRQTVQVRCAGCGKRRTRTVTVTNTVNPFNRTPIGLPKSYMDVVADVAVALAAEVQEIKQSTIICKRCLRDRDAAAALSQPSASRGKANSPTLSKAGA